MSVLTRIGRLIHHCKRLTNLDQFVKIKIIHNAIKCIVYQRKKNQGVTPLVDFDSQKFDRKFVILVHMKNICSLVIIGSFDLHECGQGKEWLLFFGNNKSHHISKCDNVIRL